MQSCKLLAYFVVAVACATNSHSVIAQTATSGSVTGTVLAGNRTPVAGAAVVLSSPDFPAHSVSTEQDGDFVVRELPSGLYTIRITAPGFAPREQSSVVVAVGRTTHVSIDLSLEGVQQTVDVVATPLELDPAQTSSVVNVDRDRVEELPIPNRNYLTFVLLSPQAMQANPALSRLGLTQGSLGFSFGGLRPGSNSVYLDGVGDNDEYTGGSRTELSPEAISDFQIVNHGFQAQAGGGAGGSIDVQTRVGVNQTHGDVFTFVQNGALNGTQRLGVYPRKPDESRMRVGASAGGPIQRDRTFYYAAAEQELARGEDVSDLSPRTLAAINSGLHQTGPLSGLTLQSGFFPTVEQETELSGRVDRTLSPKQSVMMRYAFTNARKIGEAFHTDELADRTARGSVFLSDNSLNTTLTSTSDTNVVNQFSFELAQRRAVQRTESTSGPGVLIPGVALFGTPYDGNTRRYETHIEQADTLSWTRRHHLFATGGRVDVVRLRAAVPDGAQGFFVFPNVAALQAGNAELFTQSFGSANTNLVETRFAGFTQDHWTATPKLTLDYGVRYEYNRLPSQLPQDALNLSPRIGAAWMPWKSVVVRSGFGIFYDRFQLATINRLIERDGTRGFEQIVEDMDASAAYRTGTVPRAPLPLVSPNIYRAQRGLRNPYSAVALLSAEQALPLQTTLTAEYQYVAGVRLGRTVNVNLLPPVMLTGQNAAELGFASPDAQSLGRLVFSPARADARFDAVNELQSEAHSTYHAATVTLNRQFADNFEILAGYTLSKTIDDASADLEQPENPFAIRNERALSLNDQRHRLTLSGLWLIGPDLGDPADAVANANPGPLMRVLTGLEFAPILSVSSGFRESAVTGADSNHEHVYPFAARPIGVPRNSLKTSTQVNFDLRVLRMVALGRGHLDIVAESFNLLNHPNVLLLDNVFGTGTTARTGFGSLMATSSARRVQFSLDFEF
ncbi:MAG: hypothetical protein NVS9B15_03170 [Acidobacteriaceae bacterium]